MSRGGGRQAALPQRLPQVPLPGPAAGFCEWAALGGRKKPYCFRPWEERRWAFAGLWERWEGLQGAVESAAGRFASGP
jgi:hypothetical protein